MGWMKRGMSRRGFLAGLAAASAVRPLRAQQSDAMVKWLRDAGRPFRGRRIRFTSEATPPTVVLSQISAEFTGPTGIEVDIEIVPLERVLARAVQDVQGRLGAKDIYYLDQSWVAGFAEHTFDPLQLWKDKPDLAMPDFGWDDFPAPLMDGLAMYKGRMAGIPFDIPIFITMYRKDVLERMGIRPPATLAQFTEAARQITEAEKPNGMYGAGLEAKAGHYALTCDWTQAVWNAGGSIFGRDGRFSGHDAAGIAGLQWYQEMLRYAPPQSLNATWDGLFQMMASGQCAMALTWAEHFPALDAEDSKVQGLWEAARPVTGAALRPRDQAGFGEIPNLAHQGGSVLALSRYSRNPDAAWLFMQWACSREIMTRCTLTGGFAPPRASCFDDPRVKARARVGPGTTRHFDAVRWTINNAMASEPDLPLWAEFANGVIPAELGKLLTGADYNGDARRCMDAVAARIDARLKAG